MRIRVVSSGIVSGIFCLIALWFPWYMVEPAGFVQDWAYQNEAVSFPEWLPMAVYGFCALTIFSFGWVAARWNWAKTWRSSLLAGAGSGLIAGCIIYDFIGAFRFGVLGQEEILKAFYLEVGETQGLTLLVDAISQTANLIYLNFIVVVFASVILGAFGGLASSLDLEDVWGKPPRNPDPWLFRLPAYSLSLTGYLCLIVMIVALVLLQESVVNVGIENELTGVKMPPLFIIFVAFLGCIAIVLPPIAMTWGWGMKAWKTAGLWKWLYGAWLALTIFIVGSVAYNFICYSGAGFIFPMTGFYIPLLAGFVIIVPLLLGFLIGFVGEPAVLTDEKYKFYDWLGYMLTQGILGGTQAFMSVTAYALVLALVTIENIPHLTQIEPVELSPAEQVMQLFKVMSGTAQGMILVSAVGGWLFALIVLLFRKFLRIKPAPVANPDTPAFIS